MAAEGWPCFFSHSTFETSLYFFYIPGNIKEKNGFENVKPGQLLAAVSKRVAEDQGPGKLINQFR